MKKIKLTFLFSIILVVIGIMPSQVFGKNTLTITAEKCTYSITIRGAKIEREGVKYNGTSGTPGELKQGASVGDGVVLIPPIVNIGLEYDEVIIDFSKLDRMEDNFRFRLTPKDSYYIGKYMVEVDRNENRVILRRIGMSSDATEYFVSPYNRDDDGYFQAGAVYFDGAKDMGYTAPIYKIEAEEIMNNSSWIHEVQLGNTHLSIQTIAAASSTHPECYVFCSSKGKNEADVYNFSGGQVASNAKVKIGSREFKVAGPQSANKYSGTNSNFNPLNKKMTDIVYTLSGINSEVLDQQQGTGLEAILAKLGIAIGDVFLSAFRGCVRASKY